MDFALIGRGAIGSYVRDALEQDGHRCVAVLVRGDATSEGLISSVAELPDTCPLVIDCAGHEALRLHGPAILRKGHDLITVSIGALADDALAQTLDAAAREGSSTLTLASGAIGGLDTLRAAKAGGLTRVRYVGRKPPKGWAGSPAESVLDLRALSQATPHFSGSAREAATQYPKNANVAAAVALAGLGMDATEVELIADPNASGNIHEIEAEGAFGRFSFQITGLPLVGNPRSSGLAAMSAVSAARERLQAVRF